MLSLHRLERKQTKIIQIHSVVRSKTIPDPWPKWAKRIPVSIPKRRKNPTRWGYRNLYSLYKEVSLPRVTVFFILKMSTITREYSQLIVTLRWVKKVQLYIKLLCWLVSLRDRGFNHSTQSCSSCALRGMILVHLVCSKTRQTLTDYLTFADKKCYTSHSGWKF